MVCLFLICVWFIGFGFSFVGLVFVMCVVFGLCFDCVVRCCQGWLSGAFWFGSVDGVVFWVFC